MKPTQLNVILGTLVVSLLGGGCVTFYRKTEEIGAKEPRLTVDFETEHAAQLFNSTVEKKLRQPAPTDNSRVGVPFVTFYSKTRVMSENARYNAEVVKCDSNGDGKISEAEARTYWFSNGS